jgi:MFS family permease
MRASEERDRARRQPASLGAAWVALTGLSAVFLFEMLDNSLLNLALPTIGEELGASASELQWVTGAYSLVFGGLMLLFGALADRAGRRRVMLTGLALLAAAGLATLLVRTPAELIVVRGLMGVAAAMTTPGSIALAYRLFPEDGLRVRAISLISTVGILGLAVGPTLGGLVLAAAPWQVLLLANVPVALLAFLAIRRGIAPDVPAELHRDPIDVLGALTGTLAIVLVLITPTAFIGRGIASWVPWAITAAAALTVLGFIRRERTAEHPLLDLALVARPLVSSGLAYKAATGLALSGMSYLVTLQLQLDYGWPPVLAALALLPQVAVLLALSPFVGRIVEGLGFDRTAWLSALLVVGGLAVYGLLNSRGYAWIGVSLMLVAAGIRVNGVVAGTNVLRGLPEDRTSIGSALVDTAQEAATGIGVAVSGTILAGLFTGSLAGGGWSGEQTSRFHFAVTIAALVLAATAAGLVVWAYARSRGGGGAGAAGEGRDVVGSAGLAPEDQTRRGVGEQEDADAPGEGGPDLISHRLAREESADGLDDGGHRLMLGEPPHRPGHRGGGDEGRAEERQEDQRVGEGARAVRGLGGQPGDHRDPRQGQGEQGQDAEDREPRERPGVGAEPHEQGHPEHDEQREEDGRQRGEHVRPQHARARDRHRAEALEDPACHVREDPEGGVGDA